MQTRYFLNSWFPILICCFFIAIWTNYSDGSYSYQPTPLPDYTDSQITDIIVEYEEANWLDCDGVEYIRAVVDLNVHFFDQQYDDFPGTIPEPSTPSERIQRNASLRGTIFVPKEAWNRNITVPLFMRYYYFANHEGWIDVNDDRKYHKMPFCYPTLAGIHDIIGKPCAVGIFSLRGMNGADPHSQDYDNNTEKENWYETGYQYSENDLQFLAKFLEWGRGKWWDGKLFATGLSGGAVGVLQLAKATISDPTDITKQKPLLDGGVVQMGGLDLRKNDVFFNGVPRFMDALIIWYGWGRNPDGYSEKWSPKKSRRTYGVYIIRTLDGKIHSWSSRRTFLL